MPTYHVTKWALGAGKIAKVKSDEVPDKDGFIRLKLEEHGTYGALLRMDRDVFLKKEKARTRVTAERDKKIRNLEMQITRLRMMEI